MTAVPAKITTFIFLVIISIIYLSVFKSFEISTSTSNNQIYLIESTTNAISLKNSTNINGTNKFLNYSKLLHLRNNMQCNRTDILSMYKINNRNYAPFSLRCQITNNWIGQRRSGRLEGGWFSARSNIGYIHVWKCGGTSVTNLVDKYVDLNWTASPPKHIKRDTFFADNIHNMFLFSFIRDPIQRFMSAYFEIHKRINAHNAEPHMRTLRHLDNSTLSPLQNIQAWIKKMHQQIQLYNDGKFDQRRKGMHSKPPIYKPLALFGDVHFYPQMHFLRWKQWIPFPLDYIGDINMDLADMLFDVITYYGNYRNVSKQELGQTRARNKKSTAYSSGFEQYVVDEKWLTDDDRKMLCEIYWLDYICLPIQVPPACNLTFLLQQHYGKHVVYQDCDQLTYQLKHSMIS